MRRSSSDGSSRPSARLYVVAPPAAETESIAALLPSLLCAGDVAAVLLRLAPADERALIDRVKAVAQIVQPAGAALLVEGAFEVAFRAGADGAHLTGLDALRTALPRLKPDRIAGAGGLRTRHDAMLAGEAGADYVMFGEPDADGRRPSLAAILERVAWWAELFEVPCIGYAAGLEEIGALRNAGADFIAVGAALFSDPRGPHAAMTEAARRASQTGAA
jgi:thiamine-phosphate pyrophosphorylase